MGAYDHRGKAVCGGGSVLCICVFICAHLTLGSGIRLAKRYLASVDYFMGGKERCVVMAAWLSGCVVVWLFGCVVVWLFGSLVVWYSFTASIDCMEG